MSLVHHNTGDGGHVADHNAIADYLAGPPFASANAYSARTESLIFDPETIANWTTVNCSITGDATTFTLGTKSIRLTAPFCWDNAPHRDTLAYVDFASDQTRGDYSDIVLDLRWNFAAGSWNARPGDYFELVISDTTGLGGNTATAAIPLKPSGAFYPVYISARSLTKVRSFGVRYIASKIPATDHTARSFAIYVDNIRWAAQTELERALENLSAIVVPPTYVPSSTQKVLDVPSNRAVLDLRTQGYISNDGGVKNVRQFQLLTEDGSADVRQTLTDIFATLQPGDTLVFPPGKQYRITGTDTPVYIRNLKDVTIDGRGSVIYSTEARTVTMISVWHCQGLSLRNLRLIGANPLTANGSTFVTVSGTPTVVDTTVQLNAQGEEARANSQTYYSRDKDGNVDVDFTLSDSAQVADDCVLEMVDSLAPTTGPTLTAFGTTGPVASGTRYYRVSYVDGDGFETTAGPATSITLGTNAAVDLSNIPVADTRNAPVRQRNVYRTRAGGVDEPPNYFRIAEIYDNTTTTFRDRSSDSSGPADTALTATQGGAGNVEAGVHDYVWSAFNSTTGLEGASSVRIGTVTLTVASSVSLTAVPVGPAGTTERRIYRSKANASGQGRFYYVGTIADNVTTTFTDNIADASLGDAAPESLDGQAPPILAKRTYTLTGTPTAYRLTAPGEMVVNRRLELHVRKATATANTITVHSYTTDRSRGAGSGTVEFYHGLSLVDDNGEVLIEDCELEGLSGDGLNASGTGSGSITVRRVKCRAVGRQGFTFAGNGRVRVEDCEIREPGHWGIDVEPETYGSFTNDVFIRDCDFYQGGLARGAIAADIGQERAGRIDIQRVRAFGRTGAIWAKAMIVVMDQIDAPWYEIRAVGRQSVIGRVRCAAFTLPANIAGAYTPFTTNGVTFGTVVYGPIVFSEAASTSTALTVEDPTVPIGQIIWQARSQPQVQQVPMLLKAGVPTDADFPYTPVNGTLAINTSTSKIYARLSGTWTLMT